MRKEWRFSQDIFSPAQDILAAFGWGEQDTHEKHSGNAGAKVRGRFGAAILYVHMITLPRQARDRHGNTPRKRLDLIRKRATMFPGRHHPRTLRGAREIPLKGPALFR